MGLPSPVWALRTGQAGEKKSGMGELQAALNAPDSAGAEERIKEKWLMRGLLERDVFKINDWLQKAYPNVIPEKIDVQCQPMLNEPIQIERVEGRGVTVWVNVVNLKKILRIDHLVLELEAAVPSLKTSASWAQLKREFLEDYFEESPDGLIATRDLPYFGILPEGVQLFENAGADRKIRAYAILWLNENFYGDRLNVLVALRSLSGLFAMKTRPSKSPLMSRYNEILGRMFVRIGTYRNDRHDAHVRREVERALGNVKGLRSDLEELAILVGSSKFQEEANRHPYEANEFYGQVFIRATEKAQLEIAQHLAYLEGYLTGTDAPAAGAEEDAAAGALDRFAAAAEQGTGVLVVTQAGLEAHPGLLLLAQHPQFARRMVVFAAVPPAQRARLKERGVPVVEDGDLEALVITLLAMEKADRVTVLEEVSALTQELARVLPPSVRVVHLAIGARIQALLSAFAPDEEMDRFDPEVLGVLARLLSA